MSKACAKITVLVLLLLGVGRCGNIEEVPGNVLLSATDGERSFGCTATADMSLVAEGEKVTITVRPFGRLLEGQSGVNGVYYPQISPSAPIANKEIDVDSQVVTLEITPEFSFIFTGTVTNRRHKTAQCSVGVNVIEE